MRRAARPTSRSARLVSRLFVIAVMCCVALLLWRARWMVGRVDRSLASPLPTDASPPIHLHSLPVHKHATHGPDTTNRSSQVSNSSGVTTLTFHQLAYRTIEALLLEEMGRWSVKRGSQQGSVVCDMQSNTLTTGCIVHFEAALRGSSHIVTTLPLTKDKDQKVRRRVHSNRKWLISTDEISSRLDQQAQRMKEVSVTRLEKEHGTAIDVDALSQSLKGSKSCLVAVEPALVLSRRLSRPQDIPTARIVSARGVANAELSQAALWNMLHSASVVFFVLNDVTVDGNPPSVFLDQLMRLFQTATVSKNCSFTAVRDVRDGFGDRPVVAFVHCDDASVPLSKCSEKSNDAALLSNNTSLVQLAPLCTDSPTSLKLTKALKWGTKTAIFAGSLGSRPVAVKMFHIDQYATFVGFHALVDHNTRSSYITYPTSSCLDHHLDAVFQVQPLLSPAGKNLLNFMKSEGKKLPWKHRMELAVQLLCIFSHLHQHPAGFVTFDDNHPEQYYIEQIVGGEDGKQSFLRMTMVDIDTLQVATPKADVHEVAGSPRDGKGYAVRCRCFYCHGRSDCLFINSLAGYRACGQGLDDPHQGNKEDHTRMMEGKLCDGNNDMWFIAQLLYYIGKGSVAWGQVSHKDVIQRLEAGQVPKLESSDELFNRLVDDAFHGRITLQAALSVASNLCTKYDCFVKQCAADRDATQPYIGPLSHS